ncbi:Dynactin subunit 1 [Orchesella cincta]|uniref:Dynactin subunit 1 n=1 Tax=Orchesella cincta TaxID=48709 RepID=A0A1D2NJ52_ORCCI|nr:Dynactin subunit 1 [Orchesella cincta]
MAGCIRNGRKLSSSASKRSSRGSTGSVGRGGGGKASPSPQGKMMAGEMSNLVVGTRVKLLGKGFKELWPLLVQQVSNFAGGKWVGVELDEPKGKNNGSVQGKSYFKCADEHGIFVRQSQLSVIDLGGGGDTSSPSSLNLSKGSPKNSPGTPSWTPDDNRSSKLKSRLPVFDTKLPAPALSPAFTAAIANNFSNSSTTTPTKSSSETEVNRPSNLVDGDGFVKPNGKGFINYFKNSGLLGSKKEIAKGLNNGQVKPNRSPMKWFSSFGSPKKSPQLVHSVSLSNENVYRAAGNSYESCSSFNMEDPNRWKLNSDERLAQANGVRYYDQKESPVGCLRARKAFSCDDDLSTLEDNPATDFGTSNPQYCNYSISQNKVSGLVAVKIKTKQTSTVETEEKFHAITEDDFKTCNSMSQVTSNENGKPLPKNGTLGEDSVSLNPDVTPASSRRSSISKGSSCLSKPPTPRKPPRLSLTGTKGKKSPSRGNPTSSSRLSLPVTTPRGRISSPRSKGVAPTPKKPPRHSLTGLGSFFLHATQSFKFLYERFETVNFDKFYSDRQLPVAGSRGDPKDSKSLQSTPSGSRSNLSTSGSTKFDLGSKRASFVETGFASDREIIPTYTPGTPASVISTPISTPVVGLLSGEERFSAVQALEAMRIDNKDLTEKLETLKAKRTADLEKLRELDRLRLEVETLSEFRTKVLESQAALQRDLKNARNDAREAIEAKERHAEEMAELSEAVEMATLDKEMAEEKAETLQLELEQANEKVEEVATELKTLKEEMSGKVSLDSGEVTAIHVKQYQAENARLREALLKLRDTSAHEKHQHQKTLKETEALRTEVKELSRTKERLEARLEELEAQVTDLQERNDAALGAEEMVENLTVKNLNMEEKVAQLTEAVADLEALQDVNDQLQESAKELEMELRDDLQQAIITNQNIIRDRDALMETITDYNATIVKFRDLVQKLTDENTLLRKNLEDESTKSIPGLAEALDFKKMFAETKAQTTAIDLELRRLEAKEATMHVQYLSAFMPEGFMKRGGDNDAILVLLLIPRLMCKAELLLGQVREKLMPISMTVEGVASAESIAASPDVERYAFSSQLCFLLYTLLCELHRWLSALNTCNADTFLKVGVLVSELSIQERAVDFYLELLRKSQLDENIPTDGLEKCITSFTNFYAVNLSEESIEPGTLVSDLCQASAAASDCIVIDVSRLLGMMKKTEKDSNVTALLQDIKTIGESLRQLAKRTRRYLPDLPKQPPVSSKLQSQLLNDSVTLSKVVKILQETCKQAVRHVGMLTGNEGLQSSKLEEFLQAAMDKCDSHVEGAGGIKEVIKDWLTTALMTMTDLAQVVNEAPVAPKDKAPPPISVRAQTVKAELDQTRNLRIQLEDKEASIKELRKALRAKQDELSEATIRKELAEKKLSNATKDNEMSVEKLTRKLEDIQSMLQRKEREFQATLEHFQSDIESLESERGELKEKLMSVSKIRLLEGLSRSPASTPLQSPIHGIQSSAQQIGSASAGSGAVSEGLIDYTRHLQRELWRLRSQKLVENLKNLPPLVLPKKSDDNIKQLEHELGELKSAWTRNICEALKISFNSTINASRKEFLLSENQRQKLQLAKKLANLKHRIVMTQAERKCGDVKKADFAAFNTQKSTQDAENQLRKVGMIKFPGWEKCRDEPQKIVLSGEQLRRIHQLLSPMA